MWFSHIALESLDDNTAVLSVPNKFVANWLQEKYIGEIRQALSEVTESLPEIQFHYGDRLDISEALYNKTKPSDELIPNIRTPFNASMTFQRFITDKSNRFAFSSALSIASGKTNHYNPLFIFSKDPLGKTHLLNAIGNELIKRNPQLKLGYLYPDKFISDFNQHKRSQNIVKFKEKYYSLDLLLFDDIHLLSNKKRLQEEFLSIFDKLYGFKKPIVVTGNSAPYGLIDFNSQLKSRLEWGILSEIYSPDNKIKVKIIKKRCLEDQIDIPDDIVSFIAKSSYDIKSLIKNTVRVETYLSLNRGSLNLSLVKSLLRYKKISEMGIDDIQSLTAGYFNISITELISNKKKRIYSYPRHLAIYLSRKYTAYSIQEIGQSFGHKDHSTVIYAIKRIEKLRIKDKETRNTIKQIENIISKGTD
jgi:chromosomal replication initiator protein